MFGRSLVLVVGGLMIIVAGLSGGCGNKGGGGADAALKDDEFIGTWIEVPKEEPAPTGPTGRRNPRLPVVQPRTQIFMLSVTADHNFKLTLANKDGTPADKKGAMEGTWKIEAGELRFEVTKNALGASFDEWAPAGYGGAGTGNQRILLHENGATVEYKRKS